MNTYGCMYMCKKTYTYDSHILNTPGGRLGLEYPEVWGDPAFGEGWGHGLG